MLERIMDLHLLLYTMTALGALGAVGMLAVHLTYRRAMRKTKAVMNLKEKWLNLWKTRDRLLNRMNLLDGTCGYAASSAEKSKFFTGSDSGGSSTGGD